jgi:hypothetical protein
MTICKKCGSKVFVVDETASYIEVNGEIVKHVGGGDLHNRNCVRCTYLEQYEDYKYLDEM